MEDFVAGYIAGAGAQAAPIRRAKEGKPIETEPTE
jgi:hypothetical protein